MSYIIAYCAFSYVVVLLAMISAWGDATKQEKVNGMCNFIFSPLLLPVNAVSIIFKFINRG